MRSTHTLSASYMYSSTTLDPENVLASGRVFLEDSPGIGCRAWALGLGLGAPCRSTSTRSLCFSLSATRASCHWPRQASCQFFGSGTGLPRILALRFLKRKAHARRGRAARGNNSRVMPSGTHRRGSGRNPRVSLVPFKWLPNAAALHSEGNSSGVKREVSKGALQPNYKDGDEQKKTKNRAVTLCIIPMQWQEFGLGCPALPSKYQTKTYCSSTVSVCSVPCVW